MSECVIYNPAAGRGRTKRLVEQLYRQYPGRFHLQPTSAAGHATELALKSVADGASLIIAAGGDGTVHEVSQGILQSGNRDVVFAVWPAGSANDYAFALGIDANWPLDDVKRNSMAPRQLDVGRVAGRHRESFFINCLGLGFNTYVTHEAQRIRWLRGLALYGLAFFKAVFWHFRAPDCRIVIDGDVRDGPTLALTVNLGQREGNFLVTPEAKLDDGLFDYIHAGPLTRLQALSMLPKLTNGTLPKDHPLIRLGQCREVTVQSRCPLWVHLDGEFFCRQDDDVREIQIELLPQRLNVLC